MNWEEGKLRLLVCDDEIGAQLRMLEIAKNLLSRKQLQMLEGQMNWQNINEEWECIHRLTGQGPSKVEDLVDLLQTLPIIRNIEQDAQYLEDQENPQAAEGKRKLLSASTSLKNELERFAAAIEFEFEVVDTLESALKKLAGSDGAGHDFDVVIADWRFEGSGSGLGGWLIVLAAEMMKPEEGYVSKGLYTGYKGAMDATCDVANLRQFVLDKNPAYKIEEYDKQDLRAAVADRLADAVLQGILKNLDNPSDLLAIMDSLQALRRNEQVGLSRTFRCREPVRRKLLNIPLRNFFPFVLQDMERMEQEKAEWIFNRLLGLYASGSATICDLYEDGGLKDLLFHADTPEKATELQRQGFDSIWTEVEYLDRMRRAHSQLKDGVRKSIDELFRCLLSQLSVCTPTAWRETYEKGFKNRVLLAMTGTTGDDTLTIAQIIAHINSSLQTREYNHNGQTYYYEYHTFRKGFELLIYEINSEGGGVTDIEILGQQMEVRIYQNCAFLNKSANVEGVKKPRGRLKEALSLLNLFGGVEVEGQFHNNNQERPVRWSFTAVCEKRPEILNVSDRRAVWILRLYLRGRGET